MPDAPVPELSRIAPLMSAWDRPWAIAGGWAIDLLRGCGSTGSRAHNDIDIAVLRRDQLAIQTSAFEKRMFYYWL